MSFSTVFNRWIFRSALNLQVARSEALAVDPSCLTGVEDLLTLGDFNEPVPRWAPGWIFEANTFVEFPRVFHMFSHVFFDLCSDP